MNYRVPHSLAWLLVLLVAAACGASRSVTEERAYRAREGEGELVVAAVWPWEARSELLFSQGMEMALEEVNASEGIDGRPLRIQREDDRESVNEGRLVAQRLAENPDIVAVIGHLQSHVTVPAAAIYDLAGLPLLAPAATSTELTAKGYQRVFRLTFTDLAVGLQMADYAISQGYKRIAILYVRSNYGRAVANAFDERLSETPIGVVSRDSYAPDDSVRLAALVPLFDRWRQLEPDAIFLAAEVPAAGQLIAAFREAGIDTPVMGDDAMSSPALIEVGGDAVEGTVVASFFQPKEPRPEVERFVAAFKQKFGREPDAGAAMAYDAVTLLAQAMRAAASPAPEDVASALRSLADWPGVTGSFRFDEKGDLIGRRATKSVVREGRFEYLEESPTP